MDVSLVMSVYNGEEYLHETIKSIMAQTYSNLEIIFVNNGSTDSTAAILDEVKDNRVRVLHLDHDMGVANALNTGILQAHGDWIAIHDADDISLPYRIEEQVAYLQSNPHVIAVGSFIECIGGKNFTPDKVAHAKNLEKYKNSITTWAQIKEDLLKGCPITHGALLMSREALEKAGGYNPKYKISVDYDLFTRLAQVGPIENVPKVLYKYRISSNSLSNANVQETSNDFLRAATNYMRNYCFGYKKVVPSVIVYGTKAGCQVFEGLMTMEENLHVKEIIYEYQGEKISNAYKAYKKGRIDAFIILNNAPEEDKLTRFFIRKGLKLNKDFFTLWSAI